MGQPYMAVVTTSTKVARGIAWAGLYQVFEAAVSFAAMLVLVRLISPIDYGRASAVAGFLGLMNAVSINSLVPHALQIPESQEPDWSLHWSVGCYVQGALFCCCEIIAFLCFLTRGYRPIASLLSVAGFGLLFDLANSLSINMIRRSLDYGRYRFLLGASVAFKIALIIILANYFFCARYGLFYLALIPACGTADFLAGLGLMRFRHAGVRRLLVGVSVAVNLALLVGSRHMGAVIGPMGWDWVFPLGLSFYTFQALTYTLDLYRRDAEGTSSLLDRKSVV